jgi:hypothetical protein
VESGVRTAGFRASGPACGGHRETQGKKKFGKFLERRGKREEFVRTKPGKAVSKRAAGIDEHSISHDVWGKEGDRTAA